MLSYILSVNLKDPESLKGVAAVVNDLDDASAFDLLTGTKKMNTMYRLLEHEELLRVFAQEGQTEVAHGVYDRRGVSEHNYFTINIGLSIHVVDYKKPQQGGDFTLKINIY